MLIALADFYRVSMEYLLGVRINATKDLLVGYCSRADAVF